MHVPSKRKAGYEAVASEEDAPDAFVARITSEPRRRKPVERFEAASCTGMTRDLRKKEARLGGPAPSPRCTPRVWRPRPQLATPARVVTEEQLVGVGRGSAAHAGNAHAISAQVQRVSAAEDSALYTFFMRKDFAQCQQA